MIQNFLSTKDSKVPLPGSSDRRIDVNKGDKTALVPQGAVVKPRDKRKSDETLNNRTE